MVKKLILIVAIILVLIVAGLVALVMNINGIARNVVISSSEKATKSTTQVDSVSIGLLSGDVSVDQYELANPSGFTPTHALQFNRFALSVDGRSIFSDTVVVPEITISDVDFNLEAKGMETNISTILKNIQEFAASGRTPSEEGAEPGKQFRIDRIVITNTTAHINLSPIGQLTDALGDTGKFSVTIPEIVIEPGKDKLMQAADIVAVVVPAIVDAVLAQAGDRLPAQLRILLEGDIAGIASAFGGDMETMLNDQLDKVTDQVTGELDKAAEEAGKKAEEAIDDAGKKVEEGLRGILD